MIEHQLTPVANCYVAWAVYADFDGNAPDTADLTLCATEALAKEVAKVLTESDVDDDDDEHDEIGGPIQAPLADGTIAYPGRFSLPYVEGYEHSKCYRVRETVAHRSKIATTLEDALNQCE